MEKQLGEMWVSIVVRVTTFALWRRNTAMLEEPEELVSSQCERREHCDSLRGEKVSYSTKPNVP